MDNSYLRTQLTKNARRMRPQPTAAESALWKHLRMRQVKGFKFRQQHIILGYIIDFYCPSAKLIIEVDGEIHESSRKQDEERDQVLQTTGYKVLRFKNEQIDKELDIVYLI